MGLHDNLSAKEAFQLAKSSKKFAKAYAKWHKEASRCRRINEEKQKQDAAKNGRRLDEFGQRVSGMVEIPETAPFYEVWWHLLTPGERGTVCPQVPFRHHKLLSKILKVDGGILYTADCHIMVQEEGWACDIIKSAVEESCREYRLSPSESKDYVESINGLWFERFFEACRRVNPPQEMVEYVSVLESDDETQRSAYLTLRKKCIPSILRLKQSISVDETQLKKLYNVSYEGSIMTPQKTVTQRLATPREAVLLEEIETHTNSKQRVKKTTKSARSALKHKTSTEAQ